jgi:hypothetical protein
MSQENVEVGKGIYQSTGCRRLGGGDGQVLARRRARQYTGLDGIREWFRQWFGAWEEYRDEVEDYIEAGDHVVVLFAPHGRGKGSQA